MCKKYLEYVVFQIESIANVQMFFGLGRLVYVPQQLHDMFLSGSEVYVY